MPQFQDNAGRTWTVELNTTIIKQVRSLTGLDLLDAGFFMRLAADPVLLADVLFVVCQPEANERFVTNEDFDRALAGDALAAGLEALAQARLEYSWNSQDRERAKRIAGLSRTLIDDAHAALDAQTEAVLATRHLTDSHHRPADPAGP